MKIRLCKFWLHFCFVVHFQMLSVPKHGAVTQVQVEGNFWSPHSRARAVLSYGKAAPLQQHLQRGEGGGQALLAVGTGSTEHWLTKHVAVVRTAISVLLTNTPEVRLTLCLDPQWETRGMAPLVPETALHSLFWKAHNHFPWKNERLCQFACTLLRLRTIRCFQSAALQ